MADEDRPRWLLALSLTSLLVAFVSGVVVAWGAGGAIFCKVTRRLSGGEIPLAAGVVLGACALAFVAAIVVRQRPFLLFLVISVASCALLTGLVLVATDSAVSQVVETCTLMDTTTETATQHFWLVSVAWGAPLMVLLAQVWRALRFTMITDAFAGWSTPVPAQSAASTTFERARQAVKRRRG